jgi:hypothetical protein
MDDSQRWVPGSTHLVGGLTELGFVPGSSLLLVVSHQGRGLIDCLSGERVARDATDDTTRWFDEARPAALGVGVADGIWIIVSGLAGGSPVDRTDDDWRAHPVERGIKLSRGGTVQSLSTGSEDVRAFSFSPDGQAFVLATASDLTIYLRS